MPSREALRDMHRLEVLPLGVGWQVALTILHLKAFLQAGVSMPFLHRYESVHMRR